MVFRIVEGSITSLGSISGTDATPVSVKEDTRALRVFLENPPDSHDQTVINTTAFGSGVQIVGEGTVNVSTNVSTITVSGIGQADHGALTGLSDDDHIQYILASGTRSLTGNWDNTGFRIRNTGTAEVISTAPPTPVTGLFWLDTSEPALDTEILTLQTAYDNADGVIVTSGSKPVDIQGVSGLTSTLVTSPTGTFSQSLTISGASVNIQGPLAKPFVGADGITVASGVHFDTITGFRNEFISSSGSLQTQIDSVDLQTAYDNGDGIITSTPAKPVKIEGVVSGTNLFAGSLTTSGQVSINLPADENFVIDGSTNERTITVGAFRQTHTPAMPGTRALNYVVDMNNHPDTSAIVSEYTTTGLATGDEGTVHKIDVNMANATGGKIDGIQVTRVGNGGTAEVHAIHAGLGVIPLEQESGSLGDVEKAFTFDDSLASFADVTSDFNSDVSNVQLFEEDDDLVYVGDDTQFSILTVVLVTPASNPGIKPEFEFWNGSSWTSFGPIDGTNGFRVNGVIRWSADNLMGWATTSVNGTTKFWIRIRRTANNLGTLPTEERIRVSIPTIYRWDESGDVNIHNFTASNLVTASGGTFTESLTVTGSNVVTLGELDTTVTGSPGALIVGISSLDDLGDLSTVQGNIDIIQSAGHTIGGVITSGTSDNTIDIAVGEGYIRKDDDHESRLMRFNWPAMSGVALDSTAINYVGVEYNSGNPQVVSRTAYNWNLHQEFPLGNVVSVSGILHIENAPQEVEDSTSLVLERFYRTEPKQRDEIDGGLILSESADDNQNIVVTAGAVWDRLNKFTIPAHDTSGSDVFDAFYFDGGDWLTDFSRTTWPNEQYNDITSGLVTMTNNRYAVLWFYLDVEGNVDMVYGTAQYTSEAAAEDEPAPAVPDVIVAQGFLIGRLIFQKSETIAALVETVYETAFAGSLATVHGNLTGLGDDDHPHYSLADGTRAFTGVVGGITPVASSDLSTKGYVDTVSGSLQTQIDGIDSSVTLQEAYDNGDGTIASTDGKPVQIGDLTATGTLDLRGDSTLTDLALSFSDDSNTGIFSNTDGRLSFVINGSETIRIDNVGGQRNLLILSAGNAAAPMLQFNDADTGFFRELTDTLSLSVGGTTRLTVSGVGDSTDGVGISDNLTAPTGTFSTSLTVSGLPVSTGASLPIESWALPIPFPGSGIDGTGDGSENVYFTIDYDLDAVSVLAKTVSGTLDYTLRFNDVIVEGLDNQTVNTSESVDFATSALTYTANDEITVAISGAASAKDMRWTLKTVRT